MDEHVKTGGEIAGHFMFLQYNESIENPKYGSSEEFGKTKWVSFSDHEHIVKEEIQKYKDGLKEQLKKAKDECCEPSVIQWMIDELLSQEGK